MLLRQLDAESGRSRRAGLRPVGPQLSQRLADVRECREDGRQILLEGRQQVVEPAPRDIEQQVIGCEEDPQVAEHLPLRREQHRVPARVPEIGHRVGEETVEHLRPALAGHTHRAAVGAPTERARLGQGAVLRLPVAVVGTGCRQAR